LIWDSQPAFAVVLRGYDRAHVDEYVELLRSLAAELHQAWDALGRVLLQTDALLTSGKPL